jgi:hypothetical protein
MEELPETPERMRPPLGLSRAAMYAVGASTLALLAGCSSDPEPMLESAYGSPPIGCAWDGDEVVGDACTGKFYIAPIALECPMGGYLVCDDGSWAYSTTVPVGFVPMPDAGVTTRDAGADVGDAAADATTQDGGENASDAGNSG